MKKRSKTKLFTKKTETPGFRLSCGTVATKRMWITWEYPLNLIGLKVKCRENLLLPPRLRYKSVYETDGQTSFIPPRFALQYLRERADKCKQTQPIPY